METVHDTTFKLCTAIHTNLTKLGNFFYVKLHINFKNIGVSNNHCKKDLDTIFELQNDYYRN